MGYDPDRYPRVAVTVDLVLLTIRDDALQVLLVRRGGEPFRGQLALPGGFVQPDEDLATAASRELAEEADVRGVHLEQLASYGAPDRDPRMRVISVAYLAFAPSLPEATAGSDAAEVTWAPVPEVLATGSALAFDHRRILTDGLERARAKLEYTGLARTFCPPEFTVGELRRVYELVWGLPLDPRNFHRKITGAAGLLAPITAATARGGGRPAQLYRAGPATTVNPPFLRP